jgi:hypothetical protein
MEPFKTTGSSVVSKVMREVLESVLELNLVVKESTHKSTGLLLTSLVTGFNCLTACLSTSTLHAWLRPA